MCVLGPPTTPRTVLQLALEVLAEVTVASWSSCFFPDILLWWEWSYNWHCSWHLILVFEATDVSLVLLYGVQYYVTCVAGVALPS